MVVAIVKNSKKEIRYKVNLIKVAKNFWWSLSKKKILNLINKGPKKLTRSIFVFEDKCGNGMFLGYSNDTRGKTNKHVWVVFSGILRYDFYYSDNKYDSFTVSSDTIIEKLLYPLISLVIIIKGKKLAEFIMEQIN